MFFKFFFLKIVNRSPSHLLGGRCVKGAKTNQSTPTPSTNNNNNNNNNHLGNNDDANPHSNNHHNEATREQPADDNMTEHDDEPAFKPPPKRGRRQAVAAESYDPTTDNATEESVVFYPKTEQQLDCLRQAASNIIFFKKCDEEQRKILFNAMFEKRVQVDDVIIRQGDDGDNFYVIEKGEYDIFVTESTTGGEKKVASLTEGFFGELALLYNCPRNATIVSASNDGVLWGLDQKTFRQVVVKATARKRAKFEELLKGVSMLDSLKGYELMNLTDALDEVSYESEQAIIHEGDEASEMYFIMEGKVVVRALDTRSNTQKEIVVLDRGQYFGELALVLKKPRVASVYALTNETKCAVLDINAFERLLGPCVDIMKRNIVKYEEERQRLGINSDKITDNGDNKDDKNMTKGMSNMKIQK